MSNNPMAQIKPKRQKERLHKPYQDIELIFQELKGFNHNLYLCALLTYGCLLRPHREIRELTWGDFSLDKSQIALGGDRNKSGKIRIVPVPDYVQNSLIRSLDNNQNIFSKTTKAYNKEYFKTLWGRFKKYSKLLDPHQTLYSFRHSGAISIYNQTKSIYTLKEIMGHSSINTTESYLRGFTNQNYVFPEITRIA